MDLLKRKSKVIHYESIFGNFSLCSQKIMNKENLTTNCEKITCNICKKLSLNITNRKTDNQSIN